MKRTRHTRARPGKGVAKFTFIAGLETNPFYETDTEAWLTTFWAGS